MTDRDKLAMLKALLGETKLDDDALLVYLKMAGNDVIRRCHPSSASIEMHEVPAMYEDIQVQLACNRIVKRGAQGQSSFTDNGVTRVYESDNVLLNRIVPFAHVPGVNADETA